MRAIMKRQHPVWGEFPTLFDDLFNEWNTGSVMRTTTPAVNVRETEDGFDLEMAAPGFTKDSFNIKLENETLTISSALKNDKEEKKENYTRREFSYQSFKRSFTLPKNVVDAENIEAKYEDGILKLSIPKMDAVKTKPARTINIG